MPRASLQNHILTSKYENKSVLFISEVVTTNIWICLWSAEDSFFFVILLFGFFLFSKEIFFSLSEKFNIHGNKTKQSVVNKVWLINKIKQPLFQSLFYKTTIIQKFILTLKSASTMTQLKVIYIFSRNVQRSNNSNLGFLLYFKRWKFLQITGYFSTAKWRHK